MRQCCIILYYYNYLLGQSPKDTFCRPCQSIFVYVQALSHALDLMGAGLAGLFHLEQIHSAYSGHQCTWKISDSICCLRRLYRSSMDAQHYCRQTDPSPPVDTQDSQQVCHVYANVICINDAIKRERRTICIHIFKVGVRRLVNWLTNSHGLGLRGFFKMEKSSVSPHLQKSPWNLTRTHHGLSLAHQILFRCLCHLTNVFISLPGWLPACCLSLSDHRCTGW